MTYIKFRLDDGDLVSEAFPLSQAQLKKWFPDGSILLLNNNEIPWLKPYNNQKVNVQDVNALSYAYNSLSSRDCRKFDALCQAKPDQDFNDYIHALNHLNSFGLVDSFNVYADPKSLAQEFVSQFYPQGIPDAHDEDLSDDAWRKRGLQAKNDLKHTLTDKGWVFILDELPPLLDRQLAFYENHYEKLLTCTISNPSTSQFMKLTLPNDTDAIDINIARLYADLSKLTFHYDNQNLNPEVWDVLEPILQNLNPVESNSVIHLLSELDDDDLNKLQVLSSCLSLDNLEQFELLLNSLYEFELVRVGLNNPIDYAKGKLNDLIHQNFNLYQEWIDSYLDYEALGERMLDNETFVDTECGTFRVPESLTQLFKKSASKGRQS